MTNAATSAHFRCTNENPASRPSSSLSLSFLLTQCSLECVLQQASAILTAIEPCMAQAIDQSLVSIARPKEDGSRIPFAEDAPISFHATQSPYASYDLEIQPSYEKACSSAHNTHLLKTIAQKRCTEMALVDDRSKTTHRDGLAILSNHSTPSNRKQSIF